MATISTSRPNRADGRAARAGALGIVADDAEDGSMGSRSRRPAAPDPEPRLGRGLPLLTVGSVPVVAAGTTLLLGDGGSGVRSDAVYVVLAMVTVAASGVLIAVLGLLFFVLVSPERTERLVRLIKASLRNRRRRHR
jgi:hypothetical protein